MWLLLILIQISISASLKYFDYCSLCTNHVACKARKQFGPNCVDPRIIPIKRCWVLRRHNEVRNTAAGGFNGLKPACRMAYMQWDEELADLAEYHVRKCVLEHDECHKTETFPHSNQTIGWSSYSPEDEQNIKHLVTTTIDFWIEEEWNITKQSNIDKFGTPQLGEIDYYTLIINERNTHVGCAAATFKETENGGYVFSLVCNYSCGNVVDEAVYESCSIPGKKCRHRNEEYKNLCCPHEYQNENNDEKSQNQHPNSTHNNNNAKPTDNKYRHNAFLKKLKPCKKEENDDKLQCIPIGSARH